MRYLKINSYDDTFMDLLLQFHCASSLGIQIKQAGVAGWRNRKNSSIIMQQADGPHMHTQQQQHPSINPCSHLNQQAQLN